MEIIRQGRQGSHPFSLSLHMYKWSIKWCLGCLGCLVTSFSSFNSQSRLKWGRDLDRFKSTSIPSAPSKSRHSCLGVLDGFKINLVKPLGLMSIRNPLGLHRLDIRKCNAMKSQDEVEVGHDFR